MSVPLLPFALILSILALLLPVTVMVTLAVPPIEEMLAAESQDVTTLLFPLKLTTEHWVLAANVQEPEVTTDQFASAMPVAGAVPQAAVVLLHCMRTSLRVPCNMPDLVCNWVASICRLLVSEVCVLSWSCVVVLFI